MQLTHDYYSAAASKSARQNQKNSVSPFAQETFNAFLPFINIFDPGASFDGPYHSISKEDWEFFRRHKAGETPLFYPDGTKFHPYNHVIRNIYSPEHVQKHLVEHDISYCTSGTKGLGLLYLDVDAHKIWQTDDVEGKDLLQRVFPFGYFRPSSRGQNGYLKIRYSSIEAFNEAADELQATLRSLFLHAEILCDIEVKGKITHKGKSGSLAKLPFRTDVWNGSQLELFKSCPIVNIRRVEQIARQLTEQIDEDRVAKFSEKKQKIRDMAESRAKIIQLCRDHGYRGTDEEVFAKAKQHRDQQIQSRNVKSQLSGEAPDMQSPQAIDITEKPKAVPVNQIPASTRVTSRQGTSEGNAFQRNQKDLAPFVQNFYKKYRAFPTTEDALTHLHDNGLFSGDWNDNEIKRAKRVGQILESLDETFDPQLLRSSESNAVELFVGKYGWWVRSHFGPCMTADVVNLRAFDPVTLTAPVQKVAVPAKFIQTFLAVADFCLLQDPLENKAVPTNRIKKIWERVVGGASWNQTYFQVVRDRLDRMGVIRIFDRCHDNNKAWRWEAGPNFPAQSWKEEQGEPNWAKIGISYDEFITNTNVVMDEALHNTLYQTDARFRDRWDLWVRNPDIRPPPT